MRNILKLFYTYHFTILFLVLCGFSFFLIFQNNNFQRTKYIQFSHTVSGNIYGIANNLSEYFSLKETNRLLSVENAALKNKLESFRHLIRTKTDTLLDTALQQEYFYQSAKVINNTVDKQYNYITLNKGSKQGIRPDMGVITHTGIIGIVEGVSENYATVLPLLNRNFKVSAKFKKNNFMGNISWDGLNPEECLLSDIPHHIPVKVGDTIISTGYSSIFPEGVPIGTVKEFYIKDGNFFHIKLKLSCDFRMLSYVIVVSDLKKAEKVTLANKTKHD